MVWEGLRKLDDSWTIHHSVEWQADRDGVPDDGEVDFVLISPNHGVIVMEVKGGEIQVTSDAWYSVDGSRERHKIKNPFSQVQSSKRALIGHIKRSLVRSPRIPFGHVVAFPGVRRLPKLGPEAPDEIAWRAQEINDAEAAIEVLCEHWRMSPPIGDELAGAISETLAPEGEIRATLSDDVARVNAQIETWTRDQAEVLESSLENNRILVYGGAGTGKTVLATEEAARLAREGAEVLLTCYNRPLGDHLASLLKGLDNVEAVNFHRLCTDTASRAKSETGDSGFDMPDKPSRKFWSDDAPTLLVEAAERLALSFDAVIVDEGQDFSPAWFEALEMLLTDPENGRFVVFADSHQNIYQPGWEPPFEGHVSRLRRNCRNTRQIAQRVSAVWRESGESRGAYGRTPEFLEVVNPEGAHKVLRQVIHRLVNEGNLAPSQVTVLCQRKRDVQSLRGASVAGLKLDRSRGENTILVETIHRFKGLESDVIIVILDSVDDGDQQALSYIGMSRACAELIVIGSPGVKEALNWE